MKNKKLLAIAILVIVALVCVSAIVACRPTDEAHECEHKCPTCDKCTNPDCQEDACKDKCTGHTPDELLEYDMSGVTLADKTVTYNGQEQTLTVSGTLPAGVTVAYEYFNGENKLNAAPVNAGTYNVVAKFTGDSQHKAIDDKMAVLTIGKANIEVVLGSAKNASGDALAKEIILTQGKDGIYGAYVADDSTYTLEILSSNIDVDFDCYGKLNDDKTVNESSITDGKISKIGDVRYVLVTLANEDDRANYNDNVVLCVKGEQRIVEISTYEDLLLMASDIDTYSVGVRMNAIYKLMNDIDCGGKVWQTIGTRIPAGGNDTEPYAESFLSEFDGQGHKVYNFKITDESVKKENINDDNGIALGFFGFLSDANIHDVTFADITVDFSVVRLSDKSVYGDDAYAYTGSNWIYFGAVAGRVNLNDVYKVGTFFKNVSVENLNTTKLSVSHSYVGAFFGWDSGLVPEQYGTGIVPIRQNLSVKNATIVAEERISLTKPIDPATIYLGGFVGGLFTYQPLVYENCSVSDITLVCERDMTGTDDPNEYFGSYMAGFVAWHYNLTWPQNMLTAYGDNRDGFKNSTLKNYTIINKSNSRNDRNAIECGYELAANKSDAVFVDCTVENAADTDKEYGLFRYVYNTEKNKLEKFVYTGEPKWTHACTSICPVCGKCMDEDCQEEACQDKCLKHGEDHICESQCPICHKCLNEDCQEDACKDKCQDHSYDELLVYDMTGVTLEDGSVTYNGSAQTLSVQGALPDGVTVAYEYYSGETKLDSAPVNAGEYKVVAKFTGDKWHKNIADLEAALTIEKATYDLSGVKFESETFTYDGKAKTLSVSGLPEGLNLNVDCEYYIGEISAENKLDSAPVNVGVYTVVAKFTGGGVNYDAIEDQQATLTINKATYDLGEITFTGKTVKYNGEQQSLAISGTLPDGVTVVYEYYNDTTKLDAAPVNAGVYTVKAKLSGDSVNYEAIDDKTATLTISKIDIEVSLGATKNADGAALGATVVFHKVDNDAWQAFYAASGTFASYAIEILDSNVDVNVAYYTALNNGEVVESSACDGKLSATAATIYALITPVDANTVNFNNPSIIVTIQGKTSGTVEIYSYDDLLLMASDAETLPAEIRLNLVYKLMDNIDCGGKVWKTIGTIAHGEGFAHYEKAFVSEFNGNDKKISNFQITNDSINPETTGSTYGLAVGFFGFVAVANIHNVEFDNVTVDINARTLQGYTWTGASLIHFGVVAGRVNYDVGPGNGRRNFFHDIKVSNVNATVEIIFGNVGTFFGYDNGVQPGHFGNGNMTERRNLVGENIKLTAKKAINLMAPNIEQFNLGGFVGKIDTYAAVYYINCSLTDITLTLDRDVSAYPVEQRATRSFDGRLGGYVGRHDTIQGFGTVETTPRTMQDKFENCTLENYLIENKSNFSNSEYTSLYCGFDTPSNSRKEVYFNNCTETNGTDADKEYGVYRYEWNAETSVYDKYILEGTTWTLVEE